MLTSAGVVAIGYVSSKEATETSAGVWTQTGLRTLDEVQASIEAAAADRTSAQVEGVQLGRSALRAPAGRTQVSSTASAGVRDLVWVLTDSILEGVAPDLDLLAVHEAPGLGDSLSVHEHGPSDWN